MSVLALAIEIIVAPGTVQLVVDQAVDVGVVIEVALHGRVVNTAEPAAVYAVGTWGTTIKPRARRGRRW